MCCAVCRDRVCRCEPRVRCRARFEVECREAAVERTGRIVRPIAARKRNNLIPKSHASKTRWRLQILSGDSAGVTRANSNYSSRNEESVKNTWTAAFFGRGSDTLPTDDGFTRLRAGGRSVAKSDLECGAAPEGLGELARIYLEFFNSAVQPVANVSGEERIGERS